MGFGSIFYPPRSGERRDKIRRAFAVTMIVTLVGVTSLIVLRTLPHAPLELSLLGVMSAMAFGVSAILVGLRSTAAVFAGGVALVGTLANRPFQALASTPITAHGTVTCLSGSSVVGVFVRGANGDSGFASWAPIRMTEATANYSFSLASREKFRLGVGCGGTPKAWRVDLVTAWVAPGKRSFACKDRGLVGNRVFLRCHLVQS